MGQWRIAVVGGGGLAGGYIEYFWCMFRDLGLVGFSI